MGVFQFFATVRIQTVWNELRIFFVVLAVETIVSYWFSLPSLKERFWPRLEAAGAETIMTLLTHPANCLHISHNFCCCASRHSLCLLKNASLRAKYPIAQLSVCMCLITLEITAFYLSAFLSEISLCWQAADRAVVLLRVYWVHTAGWTCLTLFWTSSPALNLHWFADKCAVYVLSFNQWFFMLGQINE